MDKIELQDWLRQFPSTAPAVVIPVFNAYDDVLECIESITANTHTDTAIVIFDDASTDGRVTATLQPMAEARGFAYLRNSANLGFVEVVNRAFDWCAPRDIVVVNSDVIVPPEWLERLHAAAYFRSTIATATPLTNNGTIVSVPYRNRPTDALVDGMTTAEVDARIRAVSLHLRPIIPTAVGHCTYFKRVALDAVGCFDLAFSPGYGEEVDFSQRAVTDGFVHVVADDLFVFHKGSRSFGADGNAKKIQIQELHERIIASRYPWFHPWKDEVEADNESPLALAIEQARGSLLGYRIAIDATRVDGTTTGTQVLTLELIRALAQAPNRLGQLTVIVADSVPQDALRGVGQFVGQVMRATELKHMPKPAFDLIHRPFQMTSAGDLNILQKSARRLVVSHLDSIAFSNPSCTANPREWMHYRHLTRLAFVVADGIVFISHDGERDAEHHGLIVPPERRCVAYTGIDHHLHSAMATPPATSAEFDDAPFILMIGTDFKHKNRLFALRVLQVLVQKYVWSGKLVLAGPHVSHGGSETDEVRLIESDRMLRSRVRDLGLVSESEKQWLLEHAALVLYPSTIEGFGMVPFEAAAAGTPALTTRFTSLGETLGDQVVYMDTLNPDVGADTAWSFLSDPEIARHQVAAIQACASNFTWSKVAERVWNFYDHVLQMPPRPRETARELQWKDEQKRLQVWRRRAVSGLRIWRKQGFRILVKKTSRYVRWLNE